MKQVKNVFKLPDNWLCVNFENIIEFGPQNGLYKGPESQGEIEVKIVELGDLYTGYKDIQVNKLNTIFVKLKENEIYGLNDKDLLINRVSKTVDGVARFRIINPHLQSICFESNMMRVAVDSSMADVEYIFYLSETNEFRKQVQKYAKTSNQTSISQDGINKFKVILPPLLEQQKIADILSTVDEQIENVDFLIEKTKELKKGLMQQLLTKGIGHTEFKETEVGMIPKEWEVKKLGELANYINGRAFKPSEWEDDGIQIVRIQNLNGSLEFNYFKGEVDRKYYIDTNQLLFAWSGSRGTSFGPFIWKGQKAVLNQHIFKIDEISSRVNKQYLYYALKKITQEIEEMAHGSAGLVHVTKGTLEKMCIAIPSLEEQKKIANLLETTDNKILNHENQKKNLLNLKKGLMQQLLTGKIRVK